MKRVRRRRPKAYRQKFPRKMGMQDHTFEGIRWAGFAMPSDYEWGSKIPPTKITPALWEADKHPLVKSKRLMILRKIQETLVQNTTLQGIEQYCYFRLQGGRFYQLRVYFSGSKYFFVEENVGQNIKISRIYMSRELALQAWRLGIINFEHVIELDN